MPHVQLRLVALLSPEPLWSGDGVRGADNERDLAPVASDSPKNPLKEGLTLENLTLSEIKDLVRSFPEPDHQRRHRALAHWETLAMPKGSMGRLQDLAVWMAGWQDTLKHPRVAVFMGRHGVVDAGVSPYAVDVDRLVLDNLCNGRSTVNAICREINADLRVYELDLDTPTADFRTQPAMTESVCAHALAYGMMAVEQGVDLLALGEVGIGNTTSAAALALALWGGRASDWVGPGSGADSTILARKIDVVDKAWRLHAAWVNNDPWRALCAFGGKEMAAIVGAVMAARMARVPVLLDGFVVTVAASVLAKAQDLALEHCWSAHCSTEPGHRLLLSRLRMKPLLEVGMFVGEGVGAATAVTLVRMALRVARETASLDRQDWLEGRAV